MHVDGLLQVQICCCFRYLPPSQTLPFTLFIYLFFWNLLFDFEFSESLSGMSVCCLVHLLSFGLNETSYTRIFLCLPDFSLPIILQDPSLCLQYYNFVISESVFRSEKQYIVCKYDILFKVQSLTGDFADCLSWLQEGSSAGSLLGVHVPFNRWCSQDIGQDAGMSDPRLNLTSQFFRHSETVNSSGCCQCALPPKPWGVLFLQPLFCIYCPQTSEVGHVSVVI